MKDTDKLTILLDNQSRLEQERSYWEHDWNDISEFVLPNTKRFNSQQNGPHKTTRVFDSTAIGANEDLAGGLQGFLTSPSERWFELDTQDPTVTEKSMNARAWIQFATDIIYHVYQTPQMGFYSNTHELYLDLGGFGTGVMNIEEQIKQRMIRFKAIQLAECYTDENHFGQVDTVHRKFEMTPRQVIQKFGKEIPSDVLKEINDLHEKKPGTKLSILHAVFPREDYDRQKLTKTNMPVASFYIWLDKKRILTESGYREFPYVVPRWSKKAGDKYGYSPGMKVLPDIRMINEMSKTTIKAAQKNVDPALQVPDDGFMTQIDTRPAKINYYRAGLGDKDLIKPLVTGARVELGLDMENQRRDVIRRGFYADIMKEEKNARMSIPEVLQREEARMKLMAPQLGRLHSEYLANLISRTFNLVKRMGILPPPPPELRGQALKINYVSPLARAQRMGQAGNVQRMFEQFGNIAAVAPDIFDIFNTVELGRWLSYLHGAPVKILNSVEDVAKIREARQKQKDMAAQMEMAEKGSKSLSNVMNAAKGKDE